jgi:AraC-like DNA-binding protein
MHLLFWCAETGTWVLLKVPRLSVYAGVGKVLILDMNILTAPEGLLGRPLLSFFLRMSWVLLFTLLLTSCGQVGHYFQDSYPQELKELDQYIRNTSLNPDKVLELTATLAASSDSLSSGALSTLYKYRQLAYLQKKQYDSAATAGEQYRFYAQQTGDSVGVAESLVSLRPDDLDYKYLKAAKPYFPSAIRTFNKTGKKRELGLLHLNYGVALSLEGEYLLAQEHLLAAYTLFDKTDSAQEKTMATLHIGNLYRFIDNPRKAKFYYQEALGLAASNGDSLVLSGIYTSLGILYRLPQPDSALYFYARSLDYLPKDVKSKVRSRTRYNMANIYNDKKDYQTSLLVYQLMLGECMRQGSSECVAMAYSGIATVYGATEQREKSVEYYKKALNIADSLGLKRITVQLLPQLATVYKESGKMKEALEVREKVAILKDSLLSAESVIAVNEMENKKRQEDQNSSIISLQSQLNIRTLSLVLLGLASLVVISTLVVYRRKKGYFPVQSQQGNPSLATTPAVGEVPGPAVVQSGVLPERYPLAGPLNPIDCETEENYGRLLQYYRSEQPYLDPTLKIEEVAERVGISRSKIAQVVREKTNSNFISFTNQFRVEEAKRQLTDPATNHYKIDVIATNSGFGSRQNFYKVFETVTGLSPGSFRAATGDAPSAAGGDAHPSRSA